MRVSRLKIFSLAAVFLLSTGDVAMAEGEDELPPLPEIHETETNAPGMQVNGANDLPSLVDGNTPESAGRQNLSAGEESSAAPAQQTEQPVETESPDLLSITEKKPDEQAVGQAASKETGTAVSVTPPVFSKSMMFNAKRLARLEEAYAIYRERYLTRKHSIVDNGDSHFDELIDKITAKEPAKAPTGIYLNSILYRSPETASAWINGTKYQAGTSVNGVRVIEITPSTVELEWKTGGYDIDFTDWEEKFPAVGSEVENSLPASQKTIQVDSEEKAIHVTLKPNQHLDLIRQRVVEGKPYQPPEIAEKQGVAEAASGIANQVSGVADELFDPQTGLPGAFKNAPDMIGKLFQGEEDEEEDTKAIDGEKPAIETKAKNSSQAATFDISDDGHYYIPATLDGHDITFKADTGAGQIIISSDDAAEMGIDPETLVYDKPGTIADGSKMMAAQVNIKSFQVNDMVFKNVNVYVAKGSFAEPLLGMPFFRMVKVTSDDDKLTIIKK